jgi:5-methylcytosine-specific restriction endonuclease McrA
MSFKECIIELRQIRDKYGYGNFDTAVRMLNRERVNKNRDPREKNFPKSMYQKLFDRQKGRCLYCNDHLFVPANKGNEIDHIDPNRQDFNHPSNLQLLHGDPCNRSKSSKDIIKQSKESGKLVTEIIQPGYSREPVEGEI